MQQPRIVSLAAARPPFQYTQQEVLAYLRERIFGAEWQQQPVHAAQAQQIEKLFAASRVARRASVVDLPTFYAQPRGTAERMREYARAGYALGREALQAALAAAEAGGTTARDLTDLLVVSCTGYAAPGLDILLARDLELPPNLRRVVIGHMGCYGALVGLRQALAALRAQPEAAVALLCVELSSLHFAPTLDPEVLTSFALFGDAAVAALLTTQPNATGPALIATYCHADFAAADQMSWTITDAGFVMGLSPRVPVTLRRHVAGAVERLLAPHGLAVADVAHWLVHPGGPAILEAIQQRLELRDEQLAPSWEVLREHGNCSSATVLLVLETLLRSGRARPGEWGVMMAFGPGLTLETCLLQF